MQKFTAIESLRGWAAWWVVLGHAMHLTGTKAMLPAGIGNYLEHGDFAVQLFMIVSGFVITHLLIGRSEPYRAYITRRLFRLMPLYLVLLAAAIATGKLYAVAYGTDFAHGADMRFDRMLSEKNHWAEHIFLHLTMLHGAVPDTLLNFASTAFLAPAWSLSLEWQFYLLAPLIVMGMRWSRATTIVVILIICSIPVMFHRADWQYKSFLPLALPFFFSGIASRMLFEKRFPYLAIAVTGIATLIYWAILGFWAYRLLLPVAFTWILFLIITAREAGAFRLRWGWLDGVCWLIAFNPLMTALGRVSYSTYLCHIPLFALIVGGGMTLTGRQDQQIVIALTLLSVALTVPLSFLLYHYVEKPGVRLGNHWVRRRPVDELAAA